MNKHPHEEVILAYYRGEQIEWRFNENEPWRSVLRHRSDKPTPEPSPSFTADIQYRIKPQPPKLHKIELTQEEVETLFCALARISGNPFKTARRHTDSLYTKIGPFITTFRANELARWRMDGDGVEGSIQLRKELPK